MHKLELIDADGRSRTYDLPGSWGECTVAQLGTVAALLSAGLEHAQDKEMSDVHMRLRLLHELTGMSDAEFARIEPSDLLALRPDAMNVQRVALLPWLDWAMEPPVWHSSALPAVTVAGKRWQGPPDGLGTWGLKQWGFADALLQRLGSEQASAEALAHLLGALYHPAGTAWNNEQIEERGALLVQALDARAQLAAVLNYRALRAGLTQRYPRCFKGGEADPRGIQGMVVRMAGPKFGTVEQAYAANVHDVMVYIEQTLEEDQRQPQR